MKLLPILYKACYIFCDAPNTKPLFKFPCSNKKIFPQLEARTPCHSNKHKHSVTALRIWLSDNLVVESIYCIKKKLKFCGVWTSGGLHTDAQNFTPVIQICRPEIRNHYLGSLFILSQVALYFKIGFSMSKSLWRSRLATMSSMFKLESLPMKKVSVVTEYYYLVIQDGHYLVKDGQSIIWLKIDGALFD